MGGCWSHFGGGGRGGHVLGRFCDKVQGRVCTNYRGVTIGKGFPRPSLDDEDCDGDHRQVQGEGFTNSLVWCI